MAQIKQYGFSWPVHQTLKRLLYSVWEIFFVKMAGFTEEWVNGPTWYLSSMFLAMFILYPLLARCFDGFTRSAAPLLAVFIMGYLYASYGSLNLPLANVYVELLRACMDISLGISGFALCKSLRNINFTGFGRWLLTFLELGCYCFALVFMFIRSVSKLDYILLFALGVAVTISFSEKSYSADFLGRFHLSILGEFSLAFYLVHENWARLLNVVMIGEEYDKMLAVYFVCSLISALCLMFMVGIYKKYCVFMKNKLKKVLIQSVN